MKKIYVARDPVDGHMVRSLLESHGIAATVRGEELWSLRGALPRNEETAPSVWVARDEDEIPALEILAEQAAMEKVALAPWSCVGCGEEIEGQFGRCWKCGCEAPVTYRG